jgi:hypothetical protein
MRLRVNLISIWQCNSKFLNNKNLSKDTFRWLFERRARRVWRPKGYSYPMVVSQQFKFHWSLRTPSSLVKGGCSSHGVLAICGRPGENWSLIGNLVCRIGKLKSKYYPKKWRTAWLWLPGGRCKVGENPIGESWSPLVGCSRVALMLFMIWEAVWSLVRTRLTPPSRTMIG